MTVRVVVQSRPSGAPTIVHSEPAAAVGDEAVAVGTPSVNVKAQVAAVEDAVASVAATVIAPLAAGTPNAIAGDGQVVLSATLPSGGVAPYSYEWHRDTTTGFTPSAGTKLTGATSRNHTDTTVVNETPYFFVLRVLDSAGKEAFSVEVTATPSATAGSGDLVQFSNPKTEFVLGPMVTESDVDGSGFHLETDRVPWPVYDDIMLRKDLAEMGYKLAETAPLVPADITQVLGKAAAAASTGATSLAIQLDKPGGGGGILPNYQGATMFFESGATAIVDSYPGGANGTVTFQAPGLDAPVAQNERLVAHPTEILAYGQPTYAPRLTPEHDGTYVGYHYFYDLGLAFWTSYYRSGLDPYWKDAALLCTDIWMKRCYGDGNIGADPTGPNNGRSMNMMGNILTAIYEDETLTGRAADGRSHWWDALEGVIKRRLQQNVIQQLDSETTWPSGIRDPALILSYASILARVLPDTYEATWAHDGYAIGEMITDGAAKRAHYAREVAFAFSGATGRARGRPDGGWFCRQSLDGPILYNAGSEPDISQPFQLGLVTEAAVFAIRALESPQHAGQYTSEVADAEAAIEKIANHLWYMYGKPGTRASEIVNMDVEWRDSVFFTHGIAEGKNHCRFDGSVDLTVDGGAGTTTLIGTGTKFQTEGCYEHAPLYFWRDLPGLLTFASNRSVTGTGTDFTLLSPGDLIFAEDQHGNHYHSIVESVTNATNMTVKNAPETTVVNAGATRAHTGPLVRGVGTINSVPGQNKHTIIGTGTQWLTDFDIQDHFWVANDNGGLQYWTVLSITSDTEMFVNVRGSGFGGSNYTFYRVAKVGEAEGLYRVQSVVSETEMVITPAYPGADLTGRRIWKPRATNRLAKNRAGSIEGSRVQSVEANHTFGWLYERTGDASWLAKGDEYFSSNWGFGKGPDADIHGAQQYTFINYWQGKYAANYGKAYNQCMRSSSKYLGYRAGGAGTGAGEILIPTAADFTDHGLILTPTASAWDDRMYGMITPCSIIRVGTDLILYYIGADGDRSDGGPAHRKLGAATLADGGNIATGWTKVAGNPLLTFAPNPGHANEDEEGVFSAGAFWDGAAVQMIFGGMEVAGVNTVDGDGIHLSMGADGLTPGAQTVVLPHSGGGTWNSGDEIFPVGLFRTAAGVWWCLYTSKGSVGSWLMGLGTGPAANNMTSSDEVAEVAGVTYTGADPIKLDGSDLLIPLFRRDTEFIELWKTTEGALPSIGTLVRTLDLGDLGHVGQSDMSGITLWLDHERELWILAHMTTAWDGIHLKTAPLVRG